MSTWNTIIHLKNTAGDIDRPFFHEVVQGNLTEALQQLEQIEEPTPLIKHNLEQIIVAVCGIEPLDKVLKWWALRTKWGLNNNIYYDAIVQSIRGHHLDTAAHLYELGGERYMGNDAKVDIIYETMRTHDVGVIGRVRRFMSMGGDRWDESFLGGFVERTNFPLNDDVFRFVHTNFAADLIERRAREHQNKILVLGEESWNHGNEFWAGLEAYKQRERLEMEVEHIQSMMLPTPKTKM